MKLGTLNPGYTLDKGPTKVQMTPAFFGVALPDPSTKSNLPLTFHAGIITLL